MSGQLLFSIPFWHINGDPIKGSVEWALQFQKDNPKGHNRSNKGGYQHDLDLSQFPYIDQILELSKSFPKFKVDQAWLNISGKGHYNDVHCHPGCDISLVWYLTDTYKSLHFRDPQAYGMQPFYKPLKEEGLTMADSVNINTTAGDLIAFPAFLSHYVIPHKQDKERISIALNGDLI
tara:strand:+ start:14482 stop:15012 length:531 start_codon:yes stop_codon:yes gene_type:complete